MKLSMRAFKLANADVQYLSLVERGANRAPFKIQKTENPMFNLDRSLSRIMKGEAKPEIVGYVIGQEDNVPEIEKALKSAGVKTDAVVADSEVLVLKQGDADMGSEANVPLKFSPEFMVVCKGFSPKGFEEVLKTQKFMPGPEMAVDAFYDAVSEAFSGPDTVAKIDDAVEELHGYLTSLATNIPEQAFKVWDTFRAAKMELASKMAKPADVPQEKWDAMTPEQKAAACAAYKAETPKPAEEEKKPDPAPAPAPAEEKKPEEKKASEDKDEEEEKKAPPPSPAKPAPAPAPAIDAKQLAEVVSAAVKAATEPVFAQMQATVRKTQESITSLAAQVAEVRKESAEIGKNATAAKALAAKTEATLKGTVLSSEAGGDPEERPVRKAEGEIGSFDTAFNRNVRKADRAREAAKRSHLL